MIAFFNLHTYDKQIKGLCILCFLRIFGIGYTGLPVSAVQPDDEFSNRSTCARRFYMAGSTDRWFHRRRFFDREEISPTIKKTLAEIVF